MPLTSDVLRSCQEQEQKAYPRQSCGFPAYAGRHGKICVLLTAEEYVESAVPYQLELSLLASLAPLTSLAPLAPLAPPTRPRLAPPPPPALYPIHSLRAALRGREEP